MNEVNVKCTCGKDGWLKISENIYEVKCGNCPNVFTVLPNGMVKQSKISIMKRFANKIQGSFNIGNLTVYGDNAMHFACNYYTKKFGYICFKLPLPSGIANKILYKDKLRWYPLYLYFSPNGTPWASTFMIGKGDCTGKQGSKIDRTKAKMRKLRLGHNFKYDSENEDYNYQVMRQINNL